METVHLHLAIGSNEAIRYSIYYAELLVVFVKRKTFLNVVTRTRLITLLRNKRGAYAAYPSAGGYITIMIVESSVKRLPLT